MAWSILDCFRPQENASATVAERCPVAFLKAWLRSIQNRSKEISIYVTARAGKHSSKAGFTVLSIPPYCPRGKILRIFKE